jgi:hypothetical protein
MAKTKHSKHGNGDGTVSAYELSHLLNVSPAAVARAIREGRIEPLPSGRFDPGLARTQWSSRTEPSRSRVKADAAAVPKPVPIRSRTDAEAAVALVHRVLAEEGGDPNAPLSFEACRACESILKSRQRQLALQQAEGKLIDADAARSAVFELARRDRDALLNFPAQKSPMIAAEVGADQVKLTVVLEKYVRQFLSERADLADNLRF